MKDKLIIALHWITMLLVLALTKGGLTSVWAQWGFAIAGLGLAASALTVGSGTDPGPKLEGIFRTAYPWLHRTFYVLVAGTASLTVASLIGGAPAEAAHSARLMLFVALLFLAIFHLWRHTALNDGALRAMTPRLWHRLL